MLIGNKEKFGFELKKISDKNHISELKLFINGLNVCAFRIDNDINRRYKSTRWDLDELMLYLQDTLLMIVDDSKFPFENIKGECAADLDNLAREYEIDDENVIEEYYTKLNDWSYNHSWHHACSGAILPDVFFRKISEGIEVSYWNDQADDGIEFKNIYGFIIVPSEIYEKTINDLLIEYNNMWV